MNQMIKNTIFSLAMMLLFVSAGFAQSDKDGDEDNRGFRKDKLFTGGNLTLQFGNQVTTLGISPYFGYSITNWLDAAASLNFNYTSQRDNVVFDDKVRQTVYGPGAFVRIFPLRFLFAQAHYEFNFLKVKYIPAPNSGYQKESYSLDAHSLLVGGGYAGGREQGNSFYYLCVLWDVGKSKNSPYKDGYGRTVPIIRAGYNIGLFQGRRRF